MGVVTVSSSAARTPLGLNSRFSTCASSLKRPVAVCFKSDESKPAALVAKRESTVLPLETSKGAKKASRKVKKRSERVNAVSVEEVSPSILELDYSEAAAKLEKLYKRSPSTDDSDEEAKPRRVKRRQPRRKKSGETDATEKEEGVKCVMSQRKGKRLNLEKRIALRLKKEDELAVSTQNKKQSKNEDDDEKIDRLVREYSSTTDLSSLDWKKMKIPPVLPSSEHAWLFKLMQPMKEILKVKDTFQSNVERETTYDELAEAMKMDVVLLRKQLEVGRAARNKLIKHNLRLVLFVMNKYFQDFANGSRFQDLCQAGVKGLITAIDRFEPRRKFRLSTYGLFWIRHAIVRSMTLSSFTKVSFGLESVRVEIQRAKQELFFKLQRTPTEQEIIARVGLSPERYHEVMRASKPVASLHARHEVTNEEFINAITDVDGVEGDSKRQPALFRLALDDVLDSLKPKESLVMRQRYGLDGKGDRTLGEIAGNLNISREMVRKHEVKALMKLKHPTRVDYLRRHIWK